MSLNAVYSDLSRQVCQASLACSEVGSSGLSTAKASSAAAPPPVAQLSHLSVSLFLLELLTTARALLVVFV